MTSSGGWLPSDGRGQEEAAHCFYTYVRGSLGGACLMLDLVGILWEWWKSFTIMFSAESIPAMQVWMCSSFVYWLWHDIVGIDPGVWHIQIRKSDENCMARGFQRWRGCQAHATIGTCLPEVVRAKKVTPLTQACSCPVCCPPLYSPLKLEVLHGQCAVS